jgi:hypothetical protein
MFSFFGQALVSHDLNYSEELEETVAEPVFELCSNTDEGIFSLYHFSFFF